MKIKIALAFYTVFLVGVVAVANSGARPRPFAAVRALPFGDKASHFLLMGLLSLLVNLCLSGRSTELGRVRVLTGSLIVFVVVAAEEFSQLFLRYRSFDLIDLLCDGLGIFLFGRLACFLTRTRERRAYSG